MKIRDKLTGVIGFSGSFNTSTIGEIIVGFPEGGMDSDFIRNYDVYLESKGEWKDLALAFKVNDIIVDNYNTKFFEPVTKEDRVRGFSL